MWIPSGHLTREHRGENSVDTLYRGMVGAGETAETGDKLPTIRQHTRNSETQSNKLFSERHGPSTLVCSGFLARCRLAVTNSVNKSVVVAGDSRTPGFYAGLRRPIFVLD
jgi:hypothetical protein